jgi:hypothetical protein
MLAFVHIEKCAGTTFKSILQRNYGGGFCDVRPLFGPSDKRFDPRARGAYNSLVLDGANPSQFGPRDLQAYKRLAPWLRCVAGHSLRPCLGLESVEPNLRYVTILREPISRYISYYTYGTGRPRRAWGFSFEEYLDKPNFHNFQTKKLACNSDIEAAKLILDKHFLLVGIMEQFDQFLCLLQRRIGLANFNIAYRSLNTRYTRKSDFLNQFEHRISQNNSLDLELYNHVIETILPRQRAEYGEDLQDAVSRFKIKNESTHREASLRAFQQKLLQRLYFDPASGVIRRISGLPWGGPY